MEVRLEIKNGFKLEVNKKEFLSYELGVLLMWGIPIYLLNIQQVKHDWWVGTVICVQTATQIIDDCVHAVEASIIWCLYWMAYIVDTSSSEEDYSYSREKLEPLVDIWVEWCNSIKNLRSDWFMDLYEWSWEAVEFPYQLIFLKEEHGIIPCFLQDAVEASSMHEMQKKIVFMF